MNIFYISGFSFSHCTCDHITAIFSISQLHRSKPVSYIDVCITAIACKCDALQDSLTVGFVEYIIDCRPSGHQ